MKLPFGDNVSRLLWLFLLIIIWELTARSGLLNPLLFPDLSSILSSLGSELLKGTLLTGTLKSILFVILGLIIGSISAALISAPAISVKSAGSLLDVLTAVFHPLPGIALFPILVMIFGIGTGPLLCIIIHSVVWPLSINIRTGFENIPPIYMKIGRNYELPPFSFFFRIMLPAASPHILAGFRIAWARAWRALISAEMLFGITSGKGGLGWYIFNKRIFMDTAGLYAGLLVLVLIGMLVETVLFKHLEKKMSLRWSMEQ